MHADHKSIANRKMPDVLIPFRDESEEKKKIRAAKVLLMTSCSEKENSESMKVLFVPYTKFRSTLSAVDENLGCAWLHGVSAHCVYDDGDLNRFAENKACAVIGGWSPLTSCQSILSIAHFVPAITVAQGSDTESSWTTHQYCDNKPHHDFAIASKRVHYQ